MSNTAIAARREEAISRGVSVTTQVYADRAENSVIWDVEGRRYIDFAAGIAVVNTGHRHPKVLAAVKAQLDQFTHTCHQVVPYESYVWLAERLNNAVPGNFKKKNQLRNHRRRGSGERRKNCTRSNQPIRDHRFHRCLPWSHLHGHDTDQQGGAVQDWLRRNDA
jgi:Aminotransferase class-III